MKHFILLTNMITAVVATIYTPSSSFDRKDVRFIQNVLYNQVAIFKEDGFLTEYQARKLSKLIDDL